MDIKQEINTDPNDPEKLLNEWLEQLDDLAVGLNVRRSPGSELTAPRIDSYRFSMANLEDSQDVDLDAILGQLCAFENECEQAMVGKIDNNNIKKTHTRSPSSCSFEGPTRIGTVEGGGRTESPDNDSAFSDNVSMLSSESSASSGGSRTDASSKSSGLGMAPSQSQMDRMKAEKIRIALEKMKEASVKKLFIKAFSADDSSKSLLVDEKMTCAYVTRLLADKNHVAMDPQWAIIEHLPDLYMERLYEDHELLVDNLMMWTRDSKNKILFLERPDKYALFANPENFLITQTSSDMDKEFDEEAKTTLLEEFFSGSGVPEVDGYLYLKAESKKGWRKYYFVLRASGLYYAPKDKAKSPRDLVCLATFDVNEVYYGVGWKKKHKAPTDFCFAIKHPRLQQAKSNKFIKFLCAEDESSLARWVMGIRIAKHGRILLDNYRALVDDIAQQDIDQLAHARSCSLNSMTLNTRRDSASSGCLSVDEPAAAFESDFPPTGTIKRKPSLNPKLPLTSITRQLKEVGQAVGGANEGRRARFSDDNVSNSSTLTRQHKSSPPPTWPEEVSSNSSTLTRRSSVESPWNEIDDLPLPPPPIAVTELLIDNNIEVLPPPPPELLEPIEPNVSVTVIPPLPPPKPSPAKIASCLAGTHAQIQKRISEDGSPQRILSSPLQRQPSKRISFDDKKPLPPKRSENTRLSVVKACAPLPPPPPDFLKDLQRVMRRKWQVAQKCKQDTSTTPHEVLGFRDPPPTDYREANVSTWLQEHYGNSALYENIDSMQAVTIDVRSSLIGRKRPPPPPPVRSESTQLTHPC